MSVKVSSVLLRDAAIHLISSDAVPLTIHEAEAIAGKPINVEVYVTFIR